MLLDVTIIDETGDFDVQVVNTETDEREETLERSFDTAQQAHDYVQELAQNKRYVVTHKDANSMHTETPNPPLALFEFGFYGKKDLRVCERQTGAERLFRQLYQLPVNGDTRRVKEIKSVDGYRVAVLPEHGRNRPIKVGDLVTFTDSELRIQHQQIAEVTEVDRTHVFTKGNIAPSLRRDTILVCLAEHRI